jgi:Uma2 family endonuclease
MASLLREPAPAPLPTVPTVEAWRAMTPDERLCLQVEINAALSGLADLMSEGQPHRKAKSRAIDALGLHFKTIGRTVYLAEELAVLYPGEKPFAPDILAVLDVEQPEDDERMSWVVAEEGKGPDLVLEVLHRGNRDKDLVENVVRYAQLGIPEYFIYDRARQQIHGYRLPGPGTSRYQRMVPQLGHHRSGVLGLDLAIIGDNLEFLSGEAMLPVSADLIGRLQGMMENLEAKANKVDEALAGLREGLRALLDARGIACPDEARERIESCAEPSTLRQWLSRATTAASIDEILSDAQDERRPAQGS